MSSTATKLICNRYFLIINTYKSIYCELSCGFKKEYYGAKLYILFLLNKENQKKCARAQNFIVFLLYLKK